MRLTECQMCGLSQGKAHTSFSKGHKPASVLIVFGKEPAEEKIRLELLEFVRQLNYELKHDWYYVFAIKCFHQKSIVKPENIEACRKWLLYEIKIVDPYLIIAMGKIAMAGIVGMEYHKMLTTNIFYMKNLLGKKRQIFYADPISAHRDKLVSNLNKLRLFIKEYYA